MSSTLSNKKFLILSSVAVFIVVGAALGAIVITNKSEKPQDFSSPESTPTQGDDPQKQVPLEKEDKSTNSRPKETDRAAPTTTPAVTPETKSKDEKNKLTVKDIPKDLYGRAEYHAFKRRIEVGKFDPIKGKPVGYLFANSYCPEHSSTTKPSKYAILCMSAGKGHMAFVEKVNSDGSIRVTEMNYVGFNIVSERVIPKDQANNYHYIP